MTKSKKIAIILIIGLIVSGLSYYFLVWKPAHPKTPKTDEEKLNDWLKGGGQGTPPVNTNTGNGNINTNTYTPPTVSAAIGKNMKAFVAVNVRKTSNGDLVKTVQPGTYVGVVDGELTIAGYKYYTFGNKFYRIVASGVKLS